MTEMDRTLLVAFLHETYELFQEFLDSRDIEPSEGEQIVRNLTNLEIEK